MPDPVIVPEVVVPAADWTAGLDAEVVGHWQTKGLVTPGKATTASDVAVAVTKQYRELEKFNGVPADQIARIPKPDAPEAEVKAFWQRLGADADPKQYDFTTVKNTDGTAADPALLDAIRASASGALIPKAAAAKLAADIVKHVEGQTIEKAAQAGANLVAENAKLKSEWGLNWDANMIVAKAGAAKLGVDPAAVAALEKVAGFAKTMEAFRRVGAMSGEAKFITGENPAGSGGVMTREQATSRVKDLKNDKAWVARYLNGDTAAIREMTELNTMISAS